MSVFWLWKSAWAFFAPPCDPRWGPDAGTAHIQIRWRLSDRPAGPRGLTRRAATLHLTDEDAEAMLSPPTDTEAQLALGAPLHRNRAGDLTTVAAC